MDARLFMDGEEQMLLTIEARNSVEHIALLAWWEELCDMHPDLRRVVDGRSSLAILGPDLKVSWEVRKDTETRKERERQASKKGKSE